MSPLSERGEGGMCECVFYSSVGRESSMCVCVCVCLCVCVSVCVCVRAHVW